MEWKVCECKRAFEKTKALLTTRRIPTEMKKTFAICFIWSIVLHDNGTWIIEMW